jgi:hypothetical protein
VIGATPGTSKVCVVPTVQPSSRAVVLETIICRPEMSSAPASICMFMTLASGPSTALPESDRPPTSASSSCTSVTDSTPGTARAACAAANGTLTLKSVVSM